MKLKSLALTLLAAVGLLFNTTVRAADEPALMQPVKSVLDHYLMIQTELAKDSVQGSVLRRGDGLRRKTLVAGSRSQRKKCFLRT